MSWRACATIKCTTRIREGLRRSGVGVDGQPLADGVYCARCRSRHADPADRPLKPGARVKVIGGRLAGMTGTFLGWVQVTLWDTPRVLRDTNEARVQIGPAVFEVRSWDLRRAVRT